jgi:subtilase family serine protease
MIDKTSILNVPACALPLAIFGLGLSACSGDNSGSAGSSVNQQAPAGPVQSLALTLPTPAQSSAPAGEPQFHLAPVVLDEPTDADLEDPAGSARSAPHTQFVTDELAQLSTRRLTSAAIESVRRDGIVPSESSAYAPGATPLASGTAIATYTPAQIRAAYALPALPATGTTLSSAQAAQLGAGQTIYLVDAYDDPNAAAELAAFDQKFALPTCTVTPIATGAALPLPVAGTSGCSFSVVYVTDAGGRTSSPPAYNSGWATEIALDVQWSHATAPLARIILIEAPDAGSGLYAGVSLANSMGNGIVSMSFGAAEGGQTAALDYLFQGAGMAYVAAAGDAGSEVEWPSVSSHVLAVGGSTLTYTGTLPRSEVVWSGTGGGISQYTPTPSYQNSTVPDMGTPKNRSVSDVTFNADPSSGQYLAVIPSGSTTPSWYSAGGTSLATPQWAGILSVTNALRAQSAQAALGDAHARLYTIAAQHAPYASAFYDITQGSDGGCAVCYAAIGYDLPSGIGTPNVTSLLTALVAAPTLLAPVVTAASVSGTAGTPLSFTVSVTASDAVSYALSNAPAGMSVNASGLVSWAAPLIGTYAVTGIAKDAVTGLSGQGVYTVTIAAAQPPSVLSAAVNGTAGTALNYAVSVTHANPVSYQLGASSPSGMSISTAGVLSWLSPLSGSYAITVDASDLKTGLVGKGVMSLTITAPKAPTVTATNVSATTGQPLAFTVTVTAADPVSLSMSSAPSGMLISSTGVISWANPLKGSYAVTVTAKDTKSGLSGSAVCTVTVTQGGPVITAGALTGVAGKALTGTISLSDATSNTITLTISGIPVGVKLTPSGASLALSWASPVTGSYMLALNAKDGNGLTASVSLPITITAH